MLTRCYGFRNVSLEFVNYLQIARLSRIVYISIRIGDLVFGIFVIPNWHIVTRLLIFMMVIKRAILPGADKKKHLA